MLLVHQQKTSEFCRREAARLRRMAASAECAPMRAELLQIAEEYESLAVHFELVRD